MDLLYQPSGGPFWRDPPSSPQMDPIGNDPEKRTPPEVRWGCYGRGNVFPRRWPGSATYATGLGPSVLFILLFLEASTTDVPLPLGILHQQVNWHAGGVMFPHIGTTLPTKPLHILNFHLSFRVTITTQAT